MDDNGADGDTGPRLRRLRPAQGGRRTIDVNRVAAAWRLGTHLGLPWLWFRFRYAVRRKSGRLARRTPLRAWSELSPGAEAPLLLFRVPARPGPACVEEANAILEGRFILFSHHEVGAGFPPQWNRNQVTGQQPPPDRHWSRLGDFDFGDIKCVWELSRFPWAFPLGRAYVRTGDNRYAEGFWRLFTDWLEHNPPNRGPNWMCGQEAAFRLMAASFGVAACRNAPATEAGRLAAYGRFVRATARRIAANLDYAFSQCNNHGISEAVGLMTAGHLLRGDAEAAGWWRTGMDGLQRQLEKLVYPDGAFAQHSAIYHRVLLEDLCWVLAVFRAQGEKAPPWLEQAGKRALAFIDALMDESTGGVPLYGASDGTRILQLADGSYQDFRPVVQAGYALLHGVRRLPTGAADEAADWLTGGASWRGARHDRAAPDRMHARDGGCLHWRNGEARLFLRCATRFHHRPSQADLLHVDVSWRGQPVAVDAGTFSYNAPDFPAGAFSQAAVHNTVTFDGAEPMSKASRFLYLPWPRGTAGWSSDGTTFSASHDGWRGRGIVHTRRIRAEAGWVFVVEDAIEAGGQHRGRVHWLLADVPHEFAPGEGRLGLTLEAGRFAISWNPRGVTASLVRADPQGVRGWRAPQYWQRVPALSLALEFTIAGEAGVATRFAPLK